MFMYRLKRHVALSICLAICLAIQSGCQPESELNSVDQSATDSKIDSQQLAGTTTPSVAKSANVAGDSTNPSTNSNESQADQLPSGASAAPSEDVELANKSNEVAPTTKPVESPPNSSDATNVVQPDSPEFANAYFEAPFRLMVNDDLLNTRAKKMYPSPGMYDVDNDGQQELVVGDIFGSMLVYENTNSGKGDPVWSDFYPLNAADGKPIKVSNW